MAAPVPESWTDQRVNQLKKLWQQGKSASEIADTLGGVTRNAVIGKAHRLGLSGRPSPIKKAPIVKKPVATPVKAAPKAAPAPVAKAPLKKPAVLAPVKAAPLPTKAPVKAPIAPSAKAPVAAPTKTGASASAVPAVKSPFNLPLTPEAMARPLMVHDGKVISILELNERTCRWPIGDPKDPAFGYCGLNVHPNFPYCPGHVVMAFQSSRKDNKRVISNDVKVDEAGVPEDLEVDDIEVADGEEEIDDDTLDDDADGADDLAV